jgi:hypothetical protein
VAGVACFLGRVSISSHFKKLSPIGDLTLREDKPVRAGHNPLPRRIIRLRARIEET